MTALAQCIIRHILLFLLISFAFHVLMILHNGTARFQTVIDYRGAYEMVSQFIMSINPIYNKHFFFEL